MDNVFRGLHILISWPTWLNVPPSLCYTIPRGRIIFSHVIPAITSTYFKCAYRLLVLSHTHNKWRSPECNYSFWMQATAEQIRLAQMIYDKNDADFEDKVKQVRTVCERCCEHGICIAVCMIFKYSTNAHSSHTCLFVSSLYLWVRLSALLSCFMCTRAD